MLIIGAVLSELGLDRPYAESRPLAVRELELDPPGTGELLVRIEAAGLCHSDLSVIDGNRVRPVPMLLGHEAAGIVEAVGHGVDLRLGQRVILTFLPRCGECEACATDGLAPCTPGSAANGAGTLLSGARRLHDASGEIHHHLGVSAFATHAVVSRNAVVPVDDDVPPVLASVLGCAVLTGGGAVINAARPRPGETVAVVGLGGVGMAAVLTALAHDDVHVIAIDPVAAKLDIAVDLGADRALTPDDAVAEGIRAHSVIECAGSVRAFETAVALTRAGGRTITVGLPHPSARAEISPLALVAEGRTIIGSYLGSAVPSRDLPTFIDWWRAGRLPLERLITSTIGFDELNAAMDSLADGTVLRQVLVP